MTANHLTTIMTDISDDVAALGVTDDDGDALLLAKVERDGLNMIWSFLSPDNHLAAALTCKAFNSVRPKRRKFPWISEDMNGANPMVTETMKTRLLSIMRSPTLQAWAAALGAPSVYPHWVEIYGLRGAPEYNGRVGRALGPPNENGRVPVEVDAGAGELPRRGVHSTPSLKAILIKPANLHTLTCPKSELVYACHAEGGGDLGSSWTPVLLPRQHSCFYREEHASELLDGRGNRRGQPIDALNATMWRMAAKRQDQMDPMETMLMMGLCQDRGTVRPPSYKYAATKTPQATPDNTMPLGHAAWGRVQRSPLLAKCGVRLAIQRVERPHSRDRKSMQNQLATFLMIDTQSGMAPPHWQDGIGDTYIYKGPGGEDGMGSLEHLDMVELGFVWDYINSDLACGEYVENASVNHYRRALARYRKQRTDDDVLLPEEDVEDESDDDSLGL